MKRIIKYLTIIIYSFLILYLANSFIAIKNLEKNAYYAITVYPLVLLGAFLITKIFDKWK